MTDVSMDQTYNMA